MIFYVCGNDFDLSEHPKTAQNPFSVSSVRCGRLILHENHTVAAEPKNESVQMGDGVGLVAIGI